MPGGLLLAVADVSGWVPINAEGAALPSGPRHREGFREFLLPDLGMTPATYGAISAGSAISGAIAGIIAGRVADKVGRVRLLVPMMLLTSLLFFA
jgi:MFS family permease